MKNQLKTCGLRSLLNERGIAAINGIFMAIVMATVSGVTIDIGHAVLTQHELQNAADAAALSAATQMGGVYLAMPVAEQQDLSRDLTAVEQSLIYTMANNTTLANSASDAASLNIAQNDLEYGTWDFTTQTFTPTPAGTRPTAVQMTVQRAAGSANAPISTFFAGMLGINTMDIRATATAALGTAGGPSSPGIADVPFAISTDWFTGVANCGDGIQFSPTGANGCAGWHVFDQGNANASTLRNTVDGLKDGSYESPKIIPGQTHFNFTGGEVASSFPNLIALWDQEKTWNNDTGRFEWDINLPVYDNGGGCGNPSGSILIAGYAKAVVTVVKKQDIQAEVQCDAFYGAAPSPNGPGGGLGPNTPLSPIARLVS